jgi:Ni/Co efflux regulator RcnB
MKALLISAAILAAVVGVASASYAKADPHDAIGDRLATVQQADYAHGASHQWRRGDRMGHDDWASSQPVDYRQHRLRQPPRGYEWRESNGRYVLAAVATGVIASIILEGGR